MNRLQNGIVPIEPIVLGTNCPNGTNEFRYSLEKGSKKHHCPHCNKKTFVLYIDTITGNYLPEHYGRCDRESNCSYHLSPYLDGYAKMIWEQEQKDTGVTKVTLPKQKYFRIQPKPKPQAEPVFFDFETFKNTLHPENYEKNTFIQNLFYRVQFPFEVDEVTKIVQLYRLGTVANGYRAGANTFPFIDIKGFVRAVQVKQFDEQNHTTDTDFLHSIIEKHHTRNNEPLPEWLEAYAKQDKRISCLFGEHLLSKYQSNPVALVEAPKTAVYGTLYFGLPDTPESLIWLAVYNKSSFSFDKLKVLQGRFVYVFPDLSKDGNTFKEWKTKAKDFENRLPGTRFIFSDLLEQLAPQRDKGEGYDLADYLIKLDWRSFRKNSIEEHVIQTQSEIITELTQQQDDYYTKVSQNTDGERTKIERIEHLKRKQLQNWSDEIIELEKFFNSIQIPDQPLTLSQGSTICNWSQFVETHLKVVISNNGIATFLPYLDRLRKAKDIVQSSLII